MLTKKENTKNQSKSEKNGKNAPSEIHSHPPHAGCCQHHETSQNKPSGLLRSPQPLTPSTSTPSPRPPESSSPKTRITVKYDAGFPNQLYIRGSGANLSWEKGILLQNVKPDEWVWETNLPFATGEFKVLVNDQIYEQGDNHRLSGGATLLYTPQF